MLTLEKGKRLSGIEFVARLVTGLVALVGLVGEVVWVVVGMVRASALSNKQFKGGYLVISSDLDWWRAFVFIGVLAALATLALAGMVVATGELRHETRGHGGTSRCVLAASAMVSLLSAIAFGLYLFYRGAQSAGHLTPFAGPQAGSLPHGEVAAGYAVAGLVAAMSIWELARWMRNSRLLELAAMVGLLVAASAAAGAVGMTHLRDINTMWSSAESPSPYYTWLSEHFVSHWLTPNGFVTIGRPPSCSAIHDCVAVGAVVSSPTERGTAIEVTRDDGRSWKVIVARGLPPNAVGLYSPFTCSGSRNCWLAPFGSPPKDIYGTNDGGHTWQPRSIGSELLMLSTDLVCPTSHACFAAPMGSRAAIYVTDDAGRTWQPSLYLGTGLAVRAIGCSDARHCLAAADKFGGGTSHWKIVATSDAGATWHVFNVPPGFTPDPFAGIACPGVDDCWMAGYRKDGSGGTVGLATSNIEMWHSFDNGLSWIPVDLPVNRFKASQASMLLSCGTPNVCYLAVAGMVADGRQVEVFATHDGGATWVSHLLVHRWHGLASLPPGQLACYGATDCWVGVLSGIGESLEMFHSVDAGAHWTAERFPRVPLTMIDSGH